MQCFCITVCRDLPVLLMDSLHERSLTTDDGGKPLTSPYRDVFFRTEGRESCSSTAGIPGVCSSLPGWVYLHRRHKPEYCVESGLILSLMQCWKWLAFFPLKRDKKCIQKPMTKLHGLLANALYLHMTNYAFTHCLKVLNSLLVVNFLLEHTDGPAWSC